MLKFYKNNFLLFELISSIVLIIGVFIIFENEKVVFLQHLNALFPLMASIGSTILGFVITGLSIMTAFLETDPLKELKKTKHYKTIFDIYFSSITHFSILTVISIVGMIFPCRIIFYLIIWSTLISTLRLWRCVWILKQFIKIIHNNYQEEEEMQESDI